MNTDSLKAEIRAEQERAITEAEKQLGEGRDPIQIDGREFPRESVWAATKAIRTAWALDALYGGQELQQDGTWNAIVHIPIGKYEDEKAG